MKIVGNVAEGEANKVDQDQKPKRDQERIQNSWKPKKNLKKKGRLGKECTKCGYQHPGKLESCPAIGQECLKCGKRNHFASRCKWKEVKATDLEDDDEAGEIYQIEVAAVKLDDSQLVTLKLESGNFVRFQPDTGAQCNVLPLHVYKKASKDEKLEKVNRTQTSLVAYIWRLENQSHWSRQYPRLEKREVIPSRLPPGGQRTHPPNSRYQVMFSYEHHTVQGQ